jgi:hypothetical protein
VKFKHLWRLGLVVVLLLFSSCDWVRLRRERRNLMAVVENEMMVMEDGAVSPAVVDYLAHYNVVVLGEGRHGIPVYHDMVVNVTEALHAAGARQLLIEMGHALDHDANAYVLGQRETLSADLAVYLKALLAEIRALNAGLPVEERIEVHTFDVNHYPRYYVTRVSRVADALAAEGADVTVLHPVLEAEDDLVAVNIEAGEVGDEVLTPEALAEIHDALQAGQDRLAEAWGADVYNRVVEMTMMELRSMEVRAMWQDAYAEAHRLREEVMKDIVDRRLSEAAADGAQTVIHAGGNHAQNQHVMGTEKEWLGGYLANRSPYGGDQAFLLLITAARGTKPGGESFDVYDNGNPAELFKVLDTASRGKPVFLPLDDDYFLEQDIAVNYSGDVWRIRLKEQYDGYLLLPRAMWQPSDS